MTCSMLSIWLVNMPKDVCLGRQFDSCRLFRQTTCFMLYNMLYMLYIIKQTTCFMHAVLLATALAVCCLINLYTTGCMLSNWLKTTCCRQHTKCCMPYNQIDDILYSVYSILLHAVLSDRQLVQYTIPTYLARHHAACYVQGQTTYVLFLLSFWLDIDMHAVSIVDIDICCLLEHTTCALFC